MSTIRTVLSITFERILINATAVTGSGIKLLTLKACLEPRMSGQSCQRCVWVTAPVTFPLVAVFKCSVYNRLEVRFMHSSNQIEHTFTRKTVFHFSIIYFYRDYFWYWS